MENKIVRMVHSIYLYILLAMYFWLGILRGGIFYQTIPAFVALLKTSQELKDIEEEKEDFIKKQFWSYYKQYHQFKFQSFVLTTITLLLFAMLTYSYYNDLSMAILLPFLYFLLLTVLTSSYTCHLIANRSFGEKRLFAIGFIQVIKNIKPTMILSVCVLASILMSYYNLILFLVVFPGIYSYCVNKFVKSSIEISYVH